MTSKSPNSTSSRQLEQSPSSTSSRQSPSSRQLEQSSEQSPEQSSIVYVCYFESEMWPEANKILGVFSNRLAAVKARDIELQRFKGSPRSSHFRDPLHYHIEEFDVLHN